MGLSKREIRIAAVTAGASLTVVASLLGGAWVLRGSSSVSPYVSLVKQTSRGHAIYIKTIHDPGVVIPPHWRALVVQGSHNTHRSVVWASPDKRYLMVGAIFNRRGVNLTRQETRFAGLLPATVSPTGSPARGTPSNATSGDAVLKAPLLGTNIPASPFYAATVQYTHGVTQYGGAHDHTLYVYFDPDCIFCHHLYNHLARLAPVLKADHVQVRWLPVAILRPGGSMRAQAILQGGLSALQYNEAHFQVGIEKGGVQGLKNRRDLIHVLDNMRIFMSSGRTVGTPTLTWHGVHAAHKLGGMPTTQARLLSVIRSVAHLPKS